MTSIASTLGVGSGIDTDALIASLLAAARGPRETLITNRQSANTAEVSALADLAGGIDSFTTALSSLISGGSLYTQPNSSDPAVGVSPIAGARISNLSSTLSVQQLAQSQTLVSSATAGTTATSPVGQGTLTINSAAGAFAVTIDDGNDSYAGLAKAINDAHAGVTASVLTDSSGARLVIKGATGATQSFTLSAGAGSDPSLAAFAYDPNTGGGMTRSQVAQDAIVAVDGVGVTRSSNTITDLIPGVQLDLKAVTTAPASLTSTQPVANMRQAVIDFVDTYNALKTKIDADVAPASGTTAAGALIGDDGAKAMLTMLGQITSAVLANGGSYSTLAEIGVRTGQNGQLSVDTSRLDSALASDPDAVEAMFNPTQYSSSSAVTITSAMGRTKPGIYTLTDVTVGPPPSGKINGVPATVIGNKLVATTASGAIGLVLQPTANAASVTITVEAGLGGALQTIRDTLRDTTSGALTNSSNRLTTEATAIAADQTALDDRMATYQAQLQTQFTAMDARVAAIKATQSYLTQQIALWTKSS